MVPCGSGGVLKCSNSEHHSPSILGLCRRIMPNLPLAAQSCFRSTRWPGVGWYHPKEENAASSYMHSAPNAYICKPVRMQQMHGCQRQGSAGPKQQLLPTVSLVCPELGFRDSCSCSGGVGFSNKELDHTGFKPAAPGIRVCSVVAK